MAWTRGQPCGVASNSFHGDVRKPVGLAIAAAEQVDQRLRRQLLDCVLPRGGHHRIGQAAVAHHAVSEKTHRARRRNDTAAPIAEAVTIGRDRHARAGGEKVGDDDVGCAREMRAQHHDDRCRLREVVVHLVSDAQLHSNHVPVSSIRDGYAAIEYKAKAADFSAIGPGKKRAAVARRARGVRD